MLDHVTRFQSFLADNIVLVPRIHKAVWVVFAGTGKNENDVKTIAWAENFYVVYFYSFENVFMWRGPDSQKEN